MAKIMGTLLGMVAGVGAGLLIITLAMILLQYVEVWH